MSENKIIKILGISSIFLGAYYLRNSLLFAVDYYGLPPEYLRATFYLILSILMFWLYKNRSKYSTNKYVYFAIPIWAALALYYFITRDLPNYY